MTMAPPQSQGLSGTAFRLRRPDEEFAAFSEAHIQRMLASRPNFDEALYREASDLVARKLRRYAEASAA
jgi:hypothetical protein